MKVRREKVVCYIVVAEQLLVFRHLDFGFDEVGLQVPAGSIGPGENPAAAALREAREETGLDNLRFIRKLGVADYDITPYRFEIQHRHFFELTVEGPVPDRWESAEQDPGPPIRFECFWIPLTHGHVLQSGQAALLGRLFDPV